MFRPISAIIRFFTISLLKSVIYLPKPRGDVQIRLTSKGQLQLSIL